jgi:hypothetical protein
MGGAAIGGLTAIGGTANVGVLKEGYFRANLSGVFLYGDEFYGERSIEKGVVNYFETYYSNLLLAYGITNDLMIESEIGYFPQKMQSYSERDLDTNIISSGFSHIGLTAKYNIYNSIMNEFEFTAGAGMKIPLTTDKGNLPQHIAASTGAYSVSVQSFLHKGFKKQGLRFFLINRFDYNFENIYEYQYGTSLTNSLFITKNIIENLSGYLEIRNAIRNKDKIKKVIHDNSGGIFLTLSPQINYSYYKFNFAIFFDYPIYQKLYGSQLGLNYSAGMNLTWQTKIF